MDAFEKEHKKKMKEVTKAEELLDAAQQQFKVFEREDTKLREQKKHQKGQLKKGAAELEKLEVKAQAERHEAKTLEDDAARHEKEIGRLEGEVATEEKKLESMYEGLKGVTAPIAREIEGKQKEREPCAQAVGELQAAVKVAQTEADLIASKVAAGADAKAAAEAELASHKEQTKEQEGALKANAAEVKAGEKRVASLTATLEAAVADEAKAAAAHGAARAKLDEARTSSTGASSRGVQKAALQKAFPGQVHRLGDLGGIAKEFDVAVSTACGALDHYVVATTEIAQECVKTLRAKELGVASFIVLDKQGHLAPRMAPIATPDGSQRLFDLIDSDEQWRPAFYFALQDTLVCAGAELANSIAFGKKRWRVVTTEGVVINTSGTMEGGGKPLSGRMGSAPVAATGASDADVAKLEGAERAAAATLQGARDAKADAAAKLKEAEKEVAKLGQAAKKLTMALDAAAATAAALTQKVGDLSGGVSLSKEEEKRQKELGAELEKLNKKLAKEEAKLEAADAAIGALQEQVLAAGGVALRVQKAKVEGLHEALDNEANAATAAKAKSEGVRKKVTKTEEGLAKIAAENKELEASRAAIGERLTALEKEAEEVVAKMEACQKDVEAKRAMMAEGDAETLKKLKKSMAKAKEAEVELASQIDDKAKALKEAHKAAKGWRAKLDSLVASSAQAAADAAAASAPEEGSAAEEGSASAAGGVTELDAETLANFDLGEIQAEVTQLESLIKGMSANLSAIHEWRARDADHRARVADFDAITAERDATRVEYEGLRKQRLEEFMEGFRVIGLKLKEMYQMITLGGNAELELLDSLDPFTEGIVFSVRPPKKAWKNISNLSGGEKTLASLALVFALHHYKPTPLYIMDEIDAALDFRNVSIVANYIKERTRNAQFIIISLRNNMFELADRLVGIYKTDNCTKSIAINPAAFTVPTAPMGDRTNAPALR